MLWNNSPSEPVGAGIGWIVQKKEDIPGGNGWLTPPELEKLEKLRFTKRRADWRLGRWTAKRAVCAYGSPGGIHPEDVGIVANEDGVPEVFVGGKRSGPAISISHSGGIGFCAVAPLEMAIGCDVEKIEPRTASFISDYFTPAEVAVVDEQDPAEQPLIATLIWSAKESTLKAIKKGLSRDTRSVVIRADLSGAESGWKGLEAECVELGEKMQGWWKSSDGMVFTIVAQGKLENYRPVELV